MATEGETTQTDCRFLTERVKGAIRFGYTSSRMFGLLLLILGVGALRPCVQAESNGHDSRLTASPDWSELIASMDKMHMAMGAVQRSRFCQINVAASSGRDRHGKNTTVIRQGSASSETRAGNHHRPTARNRIDAALAETTTRKLM
jgi:hypothetical protein